jgi:hypothetical protein
MTVAMVMGVNHGGTNPPQNLQWGDANTGCPPDFCHFSKFQALAMDSSPQISTQIYATGYGNESCRDVSFCIAVERVTVSDIRTFEGWYDCSAYVRSGTVVFESVSCSNCRELFLYSTLMKEVESVLVPELVPEVRRRSERGF